MSGFVTQNILKIKSEAINKMESKNKPKIYKTIKSRKDENNKSFFYDLEVNLKLLKLNLVAEKSHNKFFNLIFYYHHLNLALIKY